MYIYVCVQIYTRIASPKAHDGWALPREYICSVFEFEAVYLNLKQRRTKEPYITQTRPSKGHITAGYIRLFSFIYVCVCICMCRNILLFHIDIKGRSTAGYIRLFSLIHVCICMYRHVQLFRIDIYSVILMAWVYVAAHRPHISSYNIARHANHL